LNVCRTPSGIRAKWISNHGTGPGNIGEISLEGQFFQFAAMLAVAAAVGAVGALLRQPLIVTFIAVGVLVGPAWLGIAVPGGEIDLLARMGIAILLFLVGLRLDLHLIRVMGPVALATGLGQVVFTSVIGVLICLAMGLSVVPALYVAVGLTFSSTIIIVKLLSDKREIDSLHGRIAVGFLIVQDIVVILVMIALSAFGPDIQEQPLSSAVGMLFRGLGLLASVGLLMKYVLPGLVHWLARSRELLILSAVAWAMVMAGLGEWLGFSREVGAFLAGASLASTPFRDAIGGRLVSLRDFLLLFFFIELGANLDLSLVAEQVGPALVLSSFVLVGNPAIVMVIMGVMGYRKRTGFLCGLTVAQISEFSFVLGALGVTLGHIMPETMGLITLVGLITIGLSTYMILYSHGLYDLLSRWLQVFERRVPHRETDVPDPSDRGIEYIVCGVGRYGGSLARSLRERGRHVLGVDFDPEAVASWRKQGHAALYGDVEDPELPDSLPLTHAQWVVSAIPGQEANLTLLQSLHERQFSGRVALTAHNAREVTTMREAGADLVLAPFTDAATQAADMLLGADDGIERS
jgi:Kef-type K+ transport system membrane component KefB